MEVKLWNDKHQREMYVNFAELYAIVKATERTYDFEGKTKLKEWIGKLSKMGAADDLTEQQLHFDLESSFNSFMAALPNAAS
ncbi:hypothetical protein PIB30_028286 [Stylosanthes scabra]|uniref:VPS28 C-terminal domain-containing protein n=1 Tax=Stylosanthes scabra TaxID=79078 RepID=A0ABU6WAV6_9FABA|nr:hypothetical protein [Stylosanthes scabra]